MDKLTRISDSVVRVEKVIPPVAERTEIVDYDLRRINEELNNFLNEERQLTMQLDEVKAKIATQQALVASLEKAAPLVAIPDCPMDETEEENGPVEEPLETNP